MAAPEPTVPELIEERYPSLSPQLREAARFVLNHPEEIALASMRTVAAKARVHPKSMLRLARELGFDGYGAFRDRFQAWLVERGASSWTGRAKRLRADRPGPGASPLLDDMLRQEQQNLDQTFGAGLAPALGQARDAILNARDVYVLGLRSLFPVAFYVHYVCRMFMSKTVLLTGLGGTFADQLRNIGAQDALLAFSYRPYAKDTVTAVDFANERGASLIAVTDSPVSPIAKRPGLTMIVSNATPTFFPTILPAMAVAQALMALLLAESGEETMAAIARSETQLNAFDVYLR
jgi:DNA-binding MurR/RpiR family transcriptional regulator